MGGNYPGAGITLGPALTFGYLAGLRLAQGVAAGAAVRRDEPVPVALGGTAEDRRGR
jgi:hypothetical protein